MQEHSVILLPLSLKQLFSPRETQWPGVLWPPPPERTVRCTEAVALVYRRVPTLRLLHSVLGSARAAHMSKDSFNTAHFSLLLFFIPVTTGAKVNLQYPCYQLTAQLTSARPVAGSEHCLLVCEALRSVLPGDDLSETTRCVPSRCREVLFLQGSLSPSFLWNFVSHCVFVYIPLLIVKFISSCLWGKQQFLTRIKHWETNWWYFSCQRPETTLFQRVRARSSNRRGR